MSTKNADDVRDGERWVAGTEEMERRGSLASMVEGHLSRNECETGFSFFGDADRLRLFSYSPTIVRSVLRHEYARVRWVFATEGGDAGRRVRDLSDISLGTEGPDIEGVSAELPLGALSIKGSPRTTDVPSDIVTTPDAAREVAAAFGGGDGE